MYSGGESAVRPAARHSACGTQFDLNIGVGDRTLMSKVVPSCPLSITIVSSSCSESRREYEWRDNLNAG